MNKSGLRDVETEGLRRDARGATSVVGLAMACFLVGVLWYLVGVGDAIFFHEQAQDAADASAFTAAVYDARGMNALALLNILWHAIAAIVVALQVIYLMITFCGYLPWASVASSSTADLGLLEGQDLISLLVILDDGGKKFGEVGEALTGVRAASGAVASAIPWIAVARSLSAAASYAPSASSTMTLAVSQVPALVFTPLLENASDEAWLSARTAPPATVGVRLGLPVQEASDPNLFCNPELADIAPLVMESVIAYGDARGSSFTAAQTSGFVYAAGRFAAALESLDCDPHGEGLSNGAYDAAAQATCAAGERLFELCRSSAIPGADGAYEIPGSNLPCELLTGWATDAPPGAQGTFDFATCMSPFLQPVLEQKGQERAGALGAWFASLSGADSIELYPWAANGNDYMAVWSLATGALLDSGTGGVRVATWGTVPRAPQPFRDVAMVAKSEFFYEPEESSPIERSGSWPDLAPIALWKPRWKARLRRVAPPMLGSGSLSALESAIGESVGPFLAAHAAVSGGQAGAGASALERLIAFVEGDSGGALQGEAERAAGFLH